MTDFIEDSYIESEYDEWYEIEGVRKIKELSRQLRTFFNYKAEIIRYRFQSSPNSIKNYINAEYVNQKKDIELLAHEFLSLLKDLRKPTQTFEEGIRSLFFYNDINYYKKLSVITENLSIKLHYFSEKNLHNHPKLLKFIIKLAEYICIVKKYLYSPFTEFYEELELNYHELVGEIEILFEEVPNVKIKKSVKQLEEKLNS